MTAHPMNLSIAGAVAAPLHVIVIGGGIGGLTMAQGLKKAGVSVAVYERDRTRTDRVRGYRVHINPTGSRALYECLPPPLFEAFARTCGKPSAGIRFVTEKMKVLLSLDDLNAPKGVATDTVARHRSVSRITLRQVLLSGLDDIVRFDKTFVRYDESATGKIIAHFADGTTAEGDVLVAADGGGSRVRANSCRRPNASIPGSWESRARSFSMSKRAGASRPSFGTGSRSLPARAATLCSWHCRRSTALPSMVSAAMKNR